MRLADSVSSESATRFLAFRPFHLKLAMRWERLEKGDGMSFSAASLLAVVESLLPS